MDLVYSHFSRTVAKVGNGLGRSWWADREDGCYWARFDSVLLVINIGDTEVAYVIQDIDGVLAKASYARKDVKMSWFIAEAVSKLAELASEGSL
jgi:hypothetical protein